MAAKAFIGGKHVFALLLTGGGASQLTKGQWHAAFVAPRATRKPRAVANSQLGVKKKSDWSALNAMDGGIVQSHSECFKCFLGDFC